MRILYLEQDRAQAQALLAKLEHSGHQVDLCHNPHEGLGRLIGECYDILIINDRMPGYCGREIIEILSRRRLLPPTLVLASQPDHDNAAAVLQLGAYDYIVKDPQGKYLEDVDLVIAQIKSQRNLTKRTMQQLEEQYRSVVEYASEGIAVTQGGRLKFMNPKLPEITGFSAKELTSRPLVEFIFPEDRERVMQYHLNRLRGRAEAEHYTFRIVDQHNRIRWLENKGVSISWEGKPATLNFLSDITERKLIEEELFRMRKLESVGVMAGGVAHDFNNLLTIILGSINIAQMYTQAEDEIFQRLSEAEKATLRARDLTQTFIAFATGGEVYQKQKINLKKLLQDTLELALSGSHLDSCCQIAPNLWPVEVDAAQIRQALHNVIENAKEAMPQGGTVYLKADNYVIRPDQHHLPLPIDQGDYVRIRIIDQGPGIPGKYLAKIFDPYFSTKERGSQKGTGLGLTLTYAIIKKHQGYIQVQPQAQRGTEVCIYLPALAGSANIATVANSPAKILVMDDEVMLRDLAKQMLECLGFEALLACHGQEAINLYQQAMQSGKRFEAVILDLTVRGAMGAQQAAQQILAIDPYAKLIVSSGYPDDPVMRTPRKYGFQASIAKPYSLRELRNVLSSLNT